MSAASMLVLSPHPDDAILGAGGTMARFVQAGGRVRVMVLAAHHPPVRPADICRRTIEEAREGYALLGVDDVHFLDRAALSLPQAPLAEISEAIHTHLIASRAQLLLVPYLDRHMDHRSVFEAAMVAARPSDQNGPRLVAACEIVSSTHWNAAHMEPCFAPNWVVDISAQLDLKLAAFACCRTEQCAFPHPRSPQVLRALAQFRGSQAGFDCGEAFEIVRISCGPECLA